ncbi:MAG: MFS transporter [Gammaproteobacteria bacterium]|nr:MFS transporter [Gammaproteobacteria bacterium]
MTTKTPTAPAIDLNSIRSLVAANYLGSIGALTIVILPGIVGVIADSLQLGPAQVGLIMSADIITMAVAMGITAFVIHKCNWRVVAVAALAVLLAGTLLSIQADSYQSMVIARLLAGIGEGMSVSVAFAIFGGTRNPDRQFGIYLVVILSVAASMLYFIPALLASGGKAYVFAVISLLVAINFIFIHWLPVSHGEEHRSLIR